MIGDLALFMYLFLLCSPLTVLQYSNIVKTYNVQFMWSILILLLSTLTILFLQVIKPYNIKQRCLSYINNLKTFFQIETAK